jgi:heme exporter protein B
LSRNAQHGDRPRHDPVSAVANSPPAKASLAESGTDASVLQAFGWALSRDLRIALRSKAELGVELLFYVIVVSLFPLATSPSRELLATIGPGVLWTAALLAALLSLPRLFAADFGDGTLEQIALSPRPLPALASGKVAAHWLTTGLPVAILAPVLGAQYALEPAVLGTLIASLLIGTPILSLLGAIGAALTLGARGGGTLLALLVLPLYAPVLIFGAGAVEAVRAGMSAAPHLSLLGAGLLLALVGAPFAVSAAVRIALD